MLSVKDPFPFIKQTNKQTNKQKNIILGLQDYQLNKVDQLSTIEHSTVSVTFQFRAHYSTVNMTRNKSLFISLPTMSLIFMVNHTKLILWYKIFYAFNSQNIFKQIQINLLLASFFLEFFFFFLFLFIELTSAEFSALWDFSTSWLEIVLE